MQNKKCLIIYNPISGKGISDKVLSCYGEILRENGYDVDIVKTEHCNHAMETMAEATYYDIVFSIGGDGTLNEVVKGNYIRDKKLIICPLPSGTCNDVASMFGYGKNPVHNLNMALNGEVNRIDIGMINNSPFTYVVGMGKLMNIPYETKGEDKRKEGYLAYVKGALGEATNKMKRYRAKVNIDGIDLDGEYSLIMISNANHIAGINNFHKEVYLDDGEMEVLLCKASNVRGFIGNFFMYLMGKKSNDVILMKAHDIKVKLLDKLDKKWCIDGEKYDYDGNEYRITVQEKMEFLVPETKTKKLFKNKAKSIYIG